MSLGSNLAGNRTFDFSFTEPHFAGLDISAGLDVYMRPPPTSPRPSFGKNTTGGQLRVGLPLTSDVGSSFNLSFAQTLIDDNDATDSVLVTDGDSYNKAWLGYGLTYSTLDNARRPTEGLYATVTQQYVLGDHDYNFLKSEAKARFFMRSLKRG